MSRTELVKKALEKYSGLKAGKIEIVSDPKVRGTIAIQVRWATDPKTAPESQFLLVGWDGVSEIDIDELEECEFDSWPPTSGSPKLFW